jgi:hypothetical protein
VSERETIRIFASQSSQPPVVVVVVVVAPVVAETRGRRRSARRRRGRFHRKWTDAERGGRSQVGGRGGIQTE